MPASDNLRKFLKETSYRLLREARGNLSKAKKRDRGRLFKSLDVKQARTGAKGYSFNIIGLAYGKQVDEGRPPTEVFGSGGLKNILKGWVTRNRARLKGRKGEFATLKDYEVSGIAFLISQKIHKRGYVGINFLSDAIKTTEKHIEKKIDKSLTKDIDLIFRRNGFN
jgi:hypothetical protein